MAWGSFQVVIVAFVVVLSAFQAILLCDDVRIG